MDPAPPPKDADPIAEASMTELFAGLIGDARDLAVGHLDQMRRETAAELDNLKAMLRHVVIAVGMLVIGAILAGHFFAIVLIDLGLPPWAGYGIVAAVAVAIGIAVIARLPGERTHADLYPEDAIAGLERDLRDVARAVRK